MSVNGAKRNFCEHLARINEVNYTAIR